MNSTQQREALNTGRQFEIDLLKAFCIILMIVCHVLDGLTTAGTGDGLLKHTIYFLGNTSSCLFIFSMGIGIVYTSHDAPATFARRGIKLFLQGHLLSFILNAFVVLFGSSISLSVLLEQEDIYTVFSTEILAFAGLTFLLIALLKRLKCKVWGFVTIAAAFQIIAIVSDGIFDNSPLAIRYLMGILIYTGSSDITTYPLFPFFIYVVFGMMFGELLKHTKNKKVFYLKSAVCGAAVCSVASVIYGLADFPIAEYAFTDVFHSNILPAAIWFSSQIVIWVMLAFFLSPLVKGKARKATEYLSKNITNIYVIHWFCLALFMIVITLVIREWLPAVTGVPLSAAICLVTIALSRLWNTIKTKMKKKKEQTDVAVAE